MWQLLLGCSIEIWNWLAYQYAMLKSVESESHVEGIINEGNRKEMST